MPDDRAARRVGRPADQGPLVLLRRQGRVLRQQGQQDQVADRRVPLPALRPGPDVGDDGRRDHRRGRRGAAQRRRSTKLEVRDGEIVAIEAGGERIEPRDVISSLPLRATVGMAGAAAAGEVQAAAQGLRYRDFLTVALVIDGEDLFPDNWIYIHDPGVRVGRIQNFRSWSPWMVPDQSKACVGLEYFCFQGDDLWEMDDDALVELGQAGARAARPRRPAARSSKGYVTRVPLAYPMYDADYGERVDAIRGWLEGDRQPAAGRPQRAAPLQQLRPLDADRDARRGEHRSTAPTTTSGRSTPSPSTTRPTSRTSSPTATRPRRRRCGSRSRPPDGA